VAKYEGNFRKIYTVIHGDVMPCVLVSGLRASEKREVSICRAKFVSEFKKTNVN
jgi:hypothetical protein